MRVVYDYDLTEEEENKLIEMLQNDPYRIYKLPVVTRKMYSSVASHFPILSLVQNPSLEFCESLIESYPSNVEYFENASDNLLLKAAKLEPGCAYYLYKKYRQINEDGSETLPSELQEEVDEIYKEVVLNYPNDIVTLYRPSTKIWLLAVKGYNERLQFKKFQIKENPPVETILEIVKEYPSFFQYFKNPSAELKLQAFQTNPCVLQYIKQKPKKLIQEVEKQNPELLKYC